MFKFIKDGKIVGVSNEPFRGKIVGNSNGSCKGGASIDEQIEDTDYTVDDYVQYNEEYVLKTSDEAVEQRKVERIAELQNRLNATDWYVVRFAETGMEVPAEIKAERQAAREEISRLREESGVSNG